MDKRSSSMRRSRSEWATIGLLTALAILNLIWGLASDFTGPLFGGAIYALAAYLCWRRRHYQVGIIGGILGFGLHLLELLTLNTNQAADLIDLICLFLNLFLPILLVLFSIRAYRRHGSPHA
jgi:hypothetical protein